MVLPAMCVGELINCLMLRFCRFVIRSLVDCLFNAMLKSPVIKVVFVRSKLVFKILKIVIRLVVVLVDRYIEMMLP